MTECPLSAVALSRVSSLPQSLDVALILKIHLPQLLALADLESL